MSDFGWGAERPHSTCNTDKAGKFDRTDTSRYFVKFHHSLEPRPKNMG